MWSVLNGNSYFFFFTNTKTCLSHLLFCVPSISRAGEDRILLAKVHVERNDFLSLPLDKGPSSVACVCVCGHPLGSRRFSETGLERWMGTCCDPPQDVGHGTKMNWPRMLTKKLCLRKQRVRTVCICFSSLITAPYPLQALVDTPAWSQASTRVKGGVPHPVWGHSMESGMAAPMAVCPAESSPLANSGSSGFCFVGESGTPFSRGDARQG